MESIFDYLQSISVDGLLTYPQYIKAALYHPKYGYYSKKRQRVGYYENTDFYTAVSLGNVFSELLLGSVETLLRGVDLSEYSFVEIGAEPGCSVLQKIESPFKGVCTFRLTDKVEIPSKSIVFSNELLDAQPFVRLVYADGGWKEKGVLLNDGKFDEVILSDYSEGVASLISELPENAAEGYQLDLSLEAEDLFQSIIQKNWSGLLVFFDYGKRWDSLVYETPQGTARTYYNHALGSDLLKNPGNQDITCHICWDRFEQLLLEAEFGGVKTQRQEAFFIYNSLNALSKVFTSNCFHSKQTLQELLHPAHMGNQFQVISGVRL